MSACPRSSSQGFSLVEVLFALSLLGVLAVLTIPGVIYSTASNNALFKCKNVTAELLVATEKRDRKSTDLSTSTVPEQIANEMRYTAKVTSGKLVSSNSLPCSNANPCYRLPDGGVIRIGGWNMASSIATFHYDPDAANPAPYDLPGVDLRLDYRTRRIATRDAFDGTSGWDPPYVRAWTRL